MQEAAPLKIRDCSRAAFPAFCPYRDTDFSGLEQRAISCRSQTLLTSIKTHGQAIHDFVYAGRGQRVPRELIAGRIDSSIKETQRLDFFQKIIENGFRSLPKISYNSPCQAM